MMNLDLRKYGTNFTRDDIYTELSAIGALPSDIQYVTILPGSSIPDYAFHIDDPNNYDSVFPNLELVYNLSSCVSIGKHAFSHCYKLRNNDISKAKTIGDAAFFYCKGLTSIKIMPGVSLPQTCFSACDQLRVVYNINKCTSIGSEAFWECDSLQNIDISSCSYLGSFAFDGCTNLITVKLKPGIKLMELTFQHCSNLTTVYNINKCTRIGNEAFLECRSLRNLDVSGANYIGDGAFYNTSLETLKLGQNVSIANATPSELFGDAMGTLRDVTIPVGWSVPANMFSGCTNLEVVRNLAYATIIGVSAFAGCHKLSNNALLGCSSIGNFAFLGCSSVTFSEIGNLPNNNLTNIGSSAFQSCVGITKMSIKAVGVGIGAFRDCYSLSQVSILGASLEDNVFIGCSNLEKVELFGSVNLNLWGTGVFGGCANLKEVTLSTETFGIGMWCFAGCSSLKKIYNLGVIKSTLIASQFLSGVNLEHNAIGVSASCLANDALGGCNMPEWNLPNIYVSEAMTNNYFGTPAGTTLKCKDGTIYTQPSDTKVWFEDGTYNTIVTSNLTRGHFIDAGLMTSRYEWTKQPTRVVLGSNVFTLGYGLFEGCHKLSSVVMNSGINTIEGAVFANCTALQNIDLTSVSSIGTSSFEGCTSLKRAIIPNVNGIEPNTFKGCTSLSKLELSPNLSRISYGAFQNCTSLSSITIPSTVEGIGNEAFSGSGLVTANIKSSLALSIDNNGSGQFKDCANLTKVTLPSSGCEIPNMCFENCNKLRTVYDLYKSTKIGNNAFSGCSALTNNNIGLCTSIGNNAFRDCSAITKMTVKWGATMGDNSFMGCWNIGTLYNLCRTSSIGDNALSGVSLSHNTITALDSGLTSKSLSGCLNESWNLPNIYISEAMAKNWYGANQGVTLKCKDGVTISNYQDSLTIINGKYKVQLKGVVDGNALVAAGYQPKSIKTIQFGTDVTGIGYEAFHNCGRLTSVTIPDSITSIGDYAFNGCSGLTSVTIGNGVTSIGYSAFDYCDNLTSVCITDLAKWCGISFNTDWSNPLFYAHNLYLNGEKVVNLTIPDGVTSIGNYAFIGCSGLTSVTIPDSVTSIGGFAFRECSGLTSVTIPDSVTSIGVNAFYGCSGLTSVNFSGKTLDQVKSMENYPWGINTDKIIVE